MVNLSPLGALFRSECGRSRTRMISLCAATDHPSPSRGKGDGAAAGAVPNSGLATSPSSGTPGASGGGQLGGSSSGAHGGNHGTRRPRGRLSGGGRDGRHGARAGARQMAQPVLIGTNISPAAAAAASGARAGVPISAGNAASPVPYTSLYARQVGAGAVVAISAPPPLRSAFEPPAERQLVSLPASGASAVGPERLSAPQADGSLIVDCSASARADDEPPFASSLPSQESSSAAPPSQVPLDDRPRATSQASIATTTYFTCRSRPPSTSSPPCAAPSPALDTSADDTACQGAAATLTTESGASDAAIAGWQPLRRSPPATHSPLAAEPRADDAPAASSSPAPPHSAGLPSPPPLYSGQQDAACEAFGTLALQPAAVPCATSSPGAEPSLPPETAALLSAPPSGTGGPPPGSPPTSAGARPLARPAAVRPRSFSAAPPRLVVRFASPPPDFASPHNLAASPNPTPATPAVTPPGIGAGGRLAHTPPYPPPNPALTPVGPLPGHASFAAAAPATFDQPLRLIRRAVRGPPAATLLRHARLPAAAAANAVAPTEPPQVSAADSGDDRDADASGGGAFYEDGRPALLETVASAPLLSTAQRPRSHSFDGSCFQDATTTAGALRPGGAAAAPHAARRLARVRPAGAAPLSVGGGAASLLAVVEQQQRVPEPSGRLPHFHPLHVALQPAPPPPPRPTAAMASAGSAPIAVAMSGAATRSDAMPTSDGAAAGASTSSEALVLPCVSPSAGEMALVGEEAAARARSPPGDVAVGESPRTPVMAGGEQQPPAPLGNGLSKQYKGMMRGWRFGERRARR